MGYTPRYQVPRWSNNFLCLNETVNLIVEADDQMYLAVRRAMRLIAHLSIWLFLLSINTRLFHLAPLARYNTSYRIASGELERLNPLYAFPMDVEASELLSHDYHQLHLFHYINSQHLNISQALAAFHDSCIAVTVPEI